MIKKYKAETQEKAIEMARQELGEAAIVLNIKKVTPKGALFTFKKPYVEITVAVDDEQSSTQADSNTAEDLTKGTQKNSALSIDSIFKTIKQKTNSEEKIEKNSSLKEEIEGKDEQIKMLMQKLQEAEDKLKTGQSSSEIDSKATKYKNDLIQFFYEIFKSKEVCDAICEDILNDLDNIAKSQNLRIDFIVKIIYNKITDILENAKAKPINLKVGEKANKVVFLGNTGVGKTTTIAKLSSKIMMVHGLKVSFITLDTYRIAAVEQLKIYAEILNSDIEVVYDLDEIDEKINIFSTVNDIVFFDTAGRSHKNEENMEEIKVFLEKIEDAEKYLVLSATIKLEDMIEIINTYSAFTDFKLIFTKVDETNGLGNILNIAKMTDKKIAYLTNGQNVPSDIEEFSPIKIAKALLGSMYK